MIEKKNILYIANARIPTEKAHGIQIMKMCEAFTNAGIDLHLILPNRKNNIKDDPFDYYKIKNKFKITYLPNIDLVGKIPRFGFLLQSFTFAWSVKKYLAKNNKEAVIYSRDILPLFYILKNKKLKLFYEIHNWPNRLNFFHKKVFVKTKFLSISNGLRKELLEYGIANKNILVSPDGVDLEEFVINISQEEARKKINFPLDKKVILYAGHLYGWKGTDTLAEAAKYFKEETIFIFVGGTEKDVIDFKNKYSAYKNIRIIGHQPQAKIPLYLKSADILVLPNSGKQKISSHYTSPMKLFEYMASSVPIIASDLPSIKEVINEDGAIFFEADNEKSLADAIKKVLENSDLGENISSKAYEEVKDYTWKKRTEKIINFLS